MINYTEDLINQLMELATNSEDTNSNKKVDDELKIPTTIILVENKKEESKTKTPDNIDNMLKPDIRDLFEFLVLPCDLDELSESYGCPQDNKLFEKQSKKVIENNDISKKTTRDNTIQINSYINKPMFISRKHGKLSEIKSISSRIRKIHGPEDIDNIIPKIKYFIFKILIQFLNQFVEIIIKGKKEGLDQNSGKQVNNRTVDFNKELMKKQLISILSDTKSDHNKNLLNDLSKNQIMKSFLELKLEDIFNYLRYKIENEIVETNKIFKTIKIRNQILDLYTLYISELNERIPEDKKIIGVAIKKDLVKLINGRKSLNEKSIKKSLKKKNK